MAKKLTDYSVEHALPKVTKAGAVRAEIPDALVPGMYLIVQPSKQKSWAVRYRLGRRPRKHTLGSYPAISLERARDLARDALFIVSKGRDPAREKAAAGEKEREAAEAEKRAQLDRFERVAREFIERYAKPKAKKKNRPDAWIETARILGLRPSKEDPSKLEERGGDVIPAWRGRRIQEITRRDVNRLLNGIVDRDAAIMANRTLAAIRKLFNWAISQGILTASPCSGIEAPSAETSRDRVLCDDEIKLVWKAAETEGWPFGPLIKVLLLTGQRLNEVAGMRWSELDLDAKVWNLPAQRVKNNRAHHVPLSEPVLEILKSLPRIKTTKGFVFTTTRDAAVSGFSRAKDRIDDAIAASLPMGSEPLPHWTFHDLRRTMASGMAKLGIDLHVVERVLNHLSGTFRGVLGVYQRHEFSAEKRTALDAWANFVLGAVTDRSHTNVVPMRAK